MNFRRDRHLILLGKEEEELLKKPSVIMSSDQKAVITRGELFALTMEIKTVRISHCLALEKLIFLCVLLHYAGTGVSVLL